MTNHAARIERLYTLAEKLGRLSGEARNLIDDLTARMMVRRVNERSIREERPNPSDRHIVSH
jgi:hypothetical protein